MLAVREEKTILDIRVNEFERTTVSAYLDDVMPEFTPLLPIFKVHRYNRGQSNRQPLRRTSSHPLSGISFKERWTDGGPSLQASLWRQSGATDRQDNFHGGVAFMTEVVLYGVVAEDLQLSSDYEGNPELIDTLFVPGKFYEKHEQDNCAYESQLVIEHDLGALMLLTTSDLPH